MLEIILENVPKIIHGTAVAVGYFVLVFCAYFACARVIRAAILASSVLWAWQHVAKKYRGKRFLRKWPRFWWEEFVEFAFKEYGVDSITFSYDEGAWEWKPWFRLKQVRGPMLKRDRAAT